MGGFLETEDTLSPLAVQHSTEWSSPRLPRSGHKSGAQNYLAEVLTLADKQKFRHNRVRVGTPLPLRKIISLINTSLKTVERAHRRGLSWQPV
jgi:hypothetical protein